jgi:hypothetical protein
MTKTDPVDVTVFTINQRAALLAEKERMLERNLSDREAMLKQQCDQFFADGRAELDQRKAEMEAAFQTKELELAERERLVKIEEERVQQLKWDFLAVLESPFPEKAA